MNQAVKSIRKTDTVLEIQIESDVFEADYTISTLPPKLLADRIDFLPSYLMSLQISLRKHTQLDGGVY